MSKTQTNFNIPDVIENSAGLYEGNLVYYFKTIFGSAQNLSNRYHNFRHLFHVAWLCYNACFYYSNLNLSGSEIMSKRVMRNLMIAALFHDFDHSGHTGHDDHEITRAIHSLKKYIGEGDRDQLEEISAMIKATEFPHKPSTSELSLPSAILRDADMSQAMSKVWIQQIVFGLGTEMGLIPTKVLEMQEGFLTNLEFNTEWGRTLFSREEIEGKKKEVRRLLSFLK